MEVLRYGYCIFIVVFFDCLLFREKYGNGYSFNCKIILNILNISDGCLVNYYS